MPDSEIVVRTLMISLPPRLGRRLVASLIFVLALTGCGGDERSDREATHDTIPAPEDPVAHDTVPTSDVVPGRPSIACEGLETSILSAPATRAGLREAFGDPDSTSSKTEPNRHVPGAIDSLFVVHYTGLVARLRKPPDGPDLAEYVRVTETRYLRYPDLGIGARSSDIVKTLGEPTETDPASLVYDCGMGAEQPVTFHLGDGVVESIEIDYYVD